MSDSSQPAVRSPLFGIIAAYRAEVRPLLHLARSVRRAAKGDFRISLSQGDAVLAISGAGMANARRAAEWLVEHNELTGMVSIGFAGGLSENAGPGTVLVATSVVDGTTGAEFACKRGLPIEFRGLTGRLVSVAAVAATRAEKQALRARWSALGTDMEAAAVAQVAARAGLDFAAIKAISDGPADELAINFQRCLTDNGGLSSVKIIFEGLRGWKQFRSLCLLAQNSRLAARSLATALIENKSVLTGEHLTDRQQ